MREVCSKSTAYAGFLGHLTAQAHIDRDCARYVQHCSDDKDRDDPRLRKTEQVVQNDADQRYRETRQQDDCENWSASLATHSTRLPLCTSERVRAADRATPEPDSRNAVTAVKLIYLDMP